MKRESEWNAAGYERISALQQQMAADALALVSLAGTETVLDVGCGQGKVTAAIAERVTRGRVVGVDPSHDMIEFANAHFAAPNLRFEVGDARTYRSQPSSIESCRSMRCTGCPSRMRHCNPFGAHCGPMGARCCASCQWESARVSRRSSRKRERRPAPSDRDPPAVKRVPPVRSQRRRKQEDAGPDGVAND